MASSAIFTRLLALWTGLIDRIRLAPQKPGSVLVNLARGEIIYEQALVAALLKIICAASHLRCTTVSSSDSPCPSRGSMPGCNRTAHFG